MVEAERKEEEVDSKNWFRSFLDAPGGEVAFVVARALHRSHLTSLQTSLH